MRIVLVCNAGMSTSVLVQKMQKVAAEKGIEADIAAYSVEVLEDLISKEKIDCVLVGPQIRHMRPNIEKVVNGRAPVALIDMKHYGTINGEAVLKQAVELKL
ncbi:MAG: PTS sugar transporter subunit IIB [Spirochaetaceae bacterium]|jgi:PTS system cellobiose-specific IIB component|nr:PTS sugar transporter subunit IIB [Spirochaetaceae bacterium]